MMNPLERAEMAASSSAHAATARSLEISRKDIADTLGLSAGVVARVTHANRLMALALAASIGMSGYAWHLASRREVVLVMFDGNYSFIGAAQTGGSLPLDDRMFVNFASQYIVLFRMRMSTEADTKTLLDNVVSPVTDDSIKGELGLVTQEQAEKTGNRDVGVLKLTSLRPLDRPKPNVVHVEVGWIEAAKDRSHATEWRAVLTVEFRPMPGAAQINAKKSPFMLIGYQGTYLGTVPRPDVAGGR